MACASVTARIENCPACDGPREGGAGRIFCLACYRDLGKSTCSYYARLSPNGDKRAEVIAMIRAQPYIVDRRELRRLGGVERRMARG